MVKNPLNHLGHPATDNYTDRFALNDSDQLF